jgi:hypothetical protein
MKKLYLFLKNTSVVAAFFLLTGSTAYGQQPICGAMAQDFDHTMGSTAGFTGDFVFAMDGTDGYLQKDNVIAPALYTITTPTYTLPAIADYVGFGFMLNGTQRVARVEIAIIYVSTITNELTTILIGQFVPTYAPGSQTAEVCRTISISELPGFPPGGRYRFRIELTPITGGGQAGETIIFDDWRTNGTLAAIPLPVTFIGLDAKRVNNNVQLTWKVAGEENVARYEVERSTDGRSFSTIASINAHGKDTYNYTDVVSSNTVFYRIKNIDNDGKSRYSIIARIANGRTELVLKAFPQPVQNLLTLQHPVISGRALISLSAADGRTVRSQVPANGSMQSAIDMSTLQKGMYLLRFADGNGAVQTLKIMKQ